MAEIVQDQAEGLRRLFARDFVRVITVAGGRTSVGKTHVVINLAISLARRGKRVLVLDSQHGRGNLDTLLGIKPRYNLTHVIRRERTLEEVMVEGPNGVGIIQAAHGLKSLAGLSVTDQNWLVHSFSQLPRPPDVVLVDAGSAGAQSSLSLAAQEIVIVVSGHRDSITDAYGLIKSLSRNFSRRHFHILVNKVESAHEARAVYANMAQVAGRFLDVTLDFMGFVPFDEKLKRSVMLCRSMAEAYPAAEGASPFKEMAAAVDQWPYPSGDSGRIESFMERLIVSSRLTEEVFNQEAFDREAFNSGVV
ncbi:MAG: AAA family ATPase [Sulfuricellaceae bacterium]